MIDAMQHPLAQAIARCTQAAFEQVDCSKGGAQVVVVLNQGGQRATGTLGDGPGTLQTLVDALLAELADPRACADPFVDFVLRRLTLAVWQARTARIVIPAAPDGSVVQ